MIRQQQPGLSLLALGLIGLGTLSFLYRAFAFGWQPMPQFHPGRERARHTMRAVYDCG